MKRCASSTASHNMMECACGSKHTFKDKCCYSFCQSLFVRSQNVDTRTAPRFRLHPVQAGQGLGIWNLRREVIYTVWQRAVQKMTIPTAVNEAEGRNRVVFGLLVINRQHRRQVHAEKCPGERNFRPLSGGILPFRDQPHGYAAVFGQT